MRKFTILYPRSQAMKRVIVSVSPIPLTSAAQNQGLAAA